MSGSNAVRVFDMTAPLTVKALTITKRRKPYPHDHPRAWAAPGATTITVTVSDGQAQVSDTFVLTVSGYRLYLPLIGR